MTLFQWAVSCRFKDFAHLEIGVTQRHAMGVIANEIRLYNQRRPKLALCRELTISHLLVAIYNQPDDTNEKVDISRKISEGTAQSTQTEQKDGR